MPSLPTPDTYSDWRSWADSLVRQLSNEDVSDASRPRPILLAHRLNDSSSNTGVERATADGLLMYDPASTSPVCAISGAWVQLGTNPGGVSIAWFGAWSAGTYPAGALVLNGTELAVADVETSEEPTGSPTDWTILAT